MAEQRSEPELRSEPGAELGHRALGTFSLSLEVPSVRKCNESSRQISFNFSDRRLSSYPEAELKKITLIRGFLSTLSLFFVVNFLYGIYWVIASGGAIRMQYALVNCLVAVLMGFSAHGYRRQPGRAWLKRGTEPMVVGWSILFVMLIIRLAHEQLYSANFLDLDFGPKGCTTNATNFVECREPSSRAFTADDGSDLFNSIGHCWQGILSVLMFEDVENSIQRWTYITRLNVNSWGASKRNRGRASSASMRPNRTTRSTASATSRLSAFDAEAVFFAPDTVRLNIFVRRGMDFLLLFVSVYPTYNVIKRLVKVGLNGFSTSSYGNNSLEWAVGFLIGMAIGMTVSARSKYTKSKLETLATRSLQNVKNNDQKTNSQKRMKMLSYGFQASVQATDKENYKWMMLRFVSGILLCVSAILSIVSFAASWGKNTSQESAAVKGQEDSAVLVAIILVPILLACTLVPLCSKIEVQTKVKSIANLQEVLQRANTPGGIETEGEFLESLMMAERGEGPKKKKQSQDVLNKAETLPDKKEEANV